MAIHERIHNREIGRRPPSNLGWLGPYDGNIIGGAMVGFGMTLTGACPGTVLVQVGTGVPSGRYAIAGGVLGGVLYTLVSKAIRRPCAPPAAASTSPGATPNHSLHGKIGLDANTAILMFEGMCISMILAARYFMPGKTETFLDPIVGGLVIGAAQLAALFLTKAPVGVSTCYEDFGRWFWACLGVKGADGKRSLLPLTKAVAFASGILASSYTLSKTVPEMIMSDNMNISPVQGILGGLVMVFGARLAGGCTSGHGISGMSMLGVSSIITVASMFAGGIGLALAM